MLRIARVWTQEVPVEWERALRAVSPISRVTPWLALRWFPMKRTVDGVVQDCGRWLVSECVPEELVSENDRDICTILAGPRPSSLPKGLRQVVESMVNDYQWRMYKEHKVWARELWIVQGSTGGHATYYTQDERNLLQLAGLPTDPPALGELPYAPFDNRVLARLRERNRLNKLGGDLAALRRSGSIEAIKAEEEAKAKEYRKAFLAFLETQAAGRAEMIASFTRKSENRGAIREATSAEVSAASRLRDEYIDTGAIPRVAA